MEREKVVYALLLALAAKSLEGEREDKKKCKGLERESSFTCALNLTVGD